MSDTAKFEEVATGLQFPEGPVALPDGSTLVVEIKRGTLTKVGVDIGVTTGGVMVWGVYAPTSRPAGALAGSYGGATAEATVVAGLGANVLVGGSNRTIALQPLSLQGQAGLNVAAGVAGIELRWVR